MASAVLFDLDDTLYDTSLQVRLARESAVKAMVAAGLDASEEEAQEALKRVVSSAGPNFSRHYDEMLKILGVEASPRIIAAGVVAYHETKKAYLIPFPDTISTLLALRERGYKTGVVTDGVPVKQWEKLIRLGLMDFFHAVVVASDREWMKPSLRPFKEAAKELGVDAKDCVMVGDRLDKDVVGAKAAGMVAVQLAGGSSSAKHIKCEQEPDYIITRLGDLLKVMPSI
ncbi:MAG: TIGR02253 family HAD-type hydrolase [Candidatus Altiarchaeota archaeon]